MKERSEVGPFTAGWQQPAPALDQTTGRGLAFCLTEDLAASHRELVPLLEELGFETHLCEVAGLHLDQHNVAAYRLIVIDLARANGAGLSLCQQLRPSSIAPILLVLRGAARGDVLRAYQVGADTHLLCPFDPREFLARTLAMLRRGPADDLLTGPARPKTL